jgi:hypothetical protein
MGKVLLHSRFCQLFLAANCIEPSNRTIIISRTQVALFWWIIMPIYTATMLSCGGVILIVHIVSTYSAIAQIIMSTGAMSSHRVMERAFEEERLPPQLAEELLRRTLQARSNQTPVSAQYKEINRSSMMNASRAPISFDASSSSDNGIHIVDMDVDLAD